MAKTKKPRSEKQLANDERLRNLKKPVDSAPVAPPATEPEEIEEEDFVPTEVQERHAQEEAGVPVDDLTVPSLGADTEEEEAVEEKPVSPQMPLQPQVDVNLIATIVATVQAMQQANPNVSQMTPEQKAEVASEQIGKSSQPNAARVSSQGVQGITYRYDIEKSHYPDPTNRLLSEPKLARFAMHENFRFRWSVDGEQFEKHGMTFAEPRFTLELFRLLFDDEGQPTGRMALVARQMQHEDDFVVRMAAAQLGLLDDYTDTEEGFRLLRDEIRYWRIQQWLFSIFTPAKINTFRRAARSENIAGKIVEVYDTEDLIDGDSGITKAGSLQTQEGIGKIKTPHS